MITIHSCIAGFTQKASRRNGLLKLNEVLMEEVGCGVNSRIWFHRWKDNFKDVAEHIWLMKEYQNDTDIQVCVYAYSWGAGWGAMQYAKHLDRANIPVKVMVLSDPVYRHPRFYMRWLAFYPKFTSIKVPKNVREVHSFFQRVNKPQGFNLVAHNNDVEEGKSKTKIHRARKLNYTHNKMDDCLEFRNKCIEVARSIK